MKSKVSLEDIQKNFDYPLQDAAKRLGVCPSVLKRLCRVHGIKRWPYRKVSYWYLLWQFDNLSYANSIMIYSIKLKSMERRVSLLESVAANVLKQYEQLKSQINSLENRRRLFIENNNEGGVVFSDDSDEEEVDVENIIINNNNNNNNNNSRNFSGNYNIATSSSSSSYNLSASPHISSSPNSCTAVNQRDINFSGFMTDPRGYAYSAPISHVYQQNNVIGTQMEQSQRSNQSQSYYLRNNNSGELYSRQTDSHSIAFSYQSYEQRPYCPLRNDCYNSTSMDLYDPCNRIEQPYHEKEYQSNPSFSSRRHAYNSGFNPYSIISSDLSNSQSGKSSSELPGIQSLFAVAKEKEDFHDTSQVNESRVLPIIKSNSYQQTQYKDESNEDRSLDAPYRPFTRFLATVQACISLTSKFGIMMWYAEPLAKELPFIYRPENIGKDPSILVAGKNVNIFGNLFNKQHRSVDMELVFEKITYTLIVNVHGVLLNTFYDQKKAIKLMVNGNCSQSDKYFNPIQNDSLLEEGGYIWFLNFKILWRNGSNAEVALPHKQVEPTQKAVEVKIQSVIE
jgi:hypothetical protein